jgi:hypothetical protein
MFLKKGLNSLGVLVIVQRLKAALKACAADIDFNAIDSQFIYYSAPTIKQISDKTLVLLEKRNGPSNGDGNAPRQRKMEELLEKYSKDIPSYHLNGQVLKNLTIGSSAQLKPWKVILTGTTGSLGSFYSQK